MEAAETQLARALATLVQRELPLSRGLETRLDAYLQLEELLRLEDSEASVTELQRHMSTLLNEFRFDLQHTTLSDVLHATLRCLSYLMHHRSLATTAFSDEHMAFFLGELVRLLFATPDQSTYKLCLWCLAMQNFPQERHKLLPRTVEGMVQAVVNPFKSRAIELQALKGLLLLLVKYPQQVGVDGAVLKIWVRPIASRLSSSELSTRTQARLLLEEATKHLSEWSDETLKMVQHCAVKYLLPVIKMHMDHDRLKDAMYLWQLTMGLLRSRFAADLGMLNQVLYVPEKCMEDEDAAVRLMAMQAWAQLVDVYRDTKGWIFNKALVSLLAGPIKVCLEQELLLNVVEAAFMSWRKILSVAVQDFNEFCASDEAKKETFPAWKKWFRELVLLPLLTLVRKRVGIKGGKAPTVEIAQLIYFAKRIWEISESGKGKSSPARSESSNSTTMGGSSLELCNKACGLGAKYDQSYDRVRITSESIGLAFLMEDVSHSVQSLIMASDECRCEYGKECANDLALTIWRGFCHRIHSSSRQERASNAVSRFGLRLLRMSIDFSFGILTSRSSSADVPTPSKNHEQNVEDESRPVVVASVGFGLEWHLQLLAPLVSDVASLGDLQAAVFHSKSKLFGHITQRMEYFKEMYAQCATVLKKWEESEAGEAQVDFSSKAKLLPYVAVNLLFEYAVFMDDVNNDHGDEKQSALKYLDVVVRKLMESVKSCHRQRSRGLESVIRFCEDAIRAAHELFDEDAVEEKNSMLTELVIVANKLTVHSYESQQNASLLLDLHQSRETTMTIAAATASTTSDTSDAEEKRVDVVVRESEYVAASLDTSTSSPCLLSGENYIRPSARPMDPSRASSVDEQPKHKTSGRYSPDIDDDKVKAGSVPVTPQASKTTEQQVTETSTAEPVGSQSAPPKLATIQSSRGTQRPSIKMSQCIYPDLVGCTESIASLYRHFPMGFRPFFSFYKLKTIGDLSALHVERVRTFGLKEPVNTVRRALEEFNGRKDRMKSLTGSPLRQRSGSTSTRPTIPTPSPHKLPKRPFQLESAPLALEERQHKRTKRSLVLDGEDVEEEEESENTRRKPKLADRVTFCLQSGVEGETRITRPGEDSQDQFKPNEKVEEKESLQEKMDTCTLKLLQHLRRSAYYMDKLVNEEESMQSEKASLQTSIATVGGVITNYQEAHDLVSRLTSQLQVAAETSSKRCRKLLDKQG